MDRADDIRAGEDEHVVVAPQVPRVGGEPIPAEVGLAETLTLDHGSHRPVEDEDAVAGGEVEGGIGHGRMSAMREAFRAASQRLS